MATRLTILFKKFPSLTNEGLFNISDRCRLQLRLIQADLKDYRIISERFPLDELPGVSKELEINKEVMGFKT